MPAFFEKFALQKAGELFKTHDTIIMVGGTGLYIKAFCEGLDEIPPIDESNSKEVSLQTTNCMDYPGYRNK
jgi:tRNA dimethylallyltransferase